MCPAIIARRCTDEDLPFLFELYSATRASEVEGFGWDKSTAESFLRSQFDARERTYAIQFPSAEDQIVFVDNVKVGRIFCDRRSSEIHLIDIAILRAYRKQGIASELISSLKAEAASSGRGVSLKVDRTAGEAIRVYQKAEFVVIRESQLMFEMEWRLPNSGQVTLRPVTEDDRELLVKIYEASRETELSMTNWGDEQRRTFAQLQLDGQTRHYREYYPNAVHSMILNDGQAVGRLYVNRGEAEIAILDITILPEFRRSGAGTHLIKEIQAEAKQSGKSVRVFVESFNPSQHLFAKLGFAVTAQEGINLKMEWNIKP